ncbi:MAG: hypothetical protein QM714_12735 [Nocardioides sp.]|uniref:hypothetical protein n=1 Tax=Nocardioides sp. TaxID=35761 RepID=UPI0039E6820E
MTAVDRSGLAEQRLRERLDHLEVSTHVEPLEDPRAYEADLGVDLPESFGEG